MKDTIFYLGLGLLCTHELDAMPNHEWRVLPLLRALDDSLGEIVFIVAHVPLFAMLIALIASMNPARRRLARTSLCGFLVVHAGLHAAFSAHAHYEFHSILSASLIYGAGVCGAAYLVAERLRA
ncbi:MAG: DUF6713 family protein [Pseudomonadota bacterium]